MAKMTKAQAKKALLAIDNKVFKLFHAGHITSGQLLGITGYTEKCLKRFR